MAQTWYKTDTAADNSSTKCDATALATNPFYIECALSDPSPSGSNTITMPAKQNYTAGAFESPGGIGTSSIPAGTWTINFNVTSAAAAGAQWREIHICEIQPGGTNVKTIGSNTGLTVDLATTGNKQGTVTLGSPVAVTSTNHWYIQLVFYCNTHAGSSVTIDRSLTIVDTIVGATTYDLAGTVAATSTVTGAATVSHATRVLAGIIAAVSVFTGNATVVKPTHALAGNIAAISTVTGDATVTHAVWDLAGSIAAQSTLAGDATVSQAQWALAGDVAAQSVFTGDLTVGTTHDLAGAIGAQSIVGGGPSLNLWPNADLESGITDWTLSGSTLTHSTTQAWEQTYSLGVAVSGGYAGAQADNFAINTSTQYALSYYIWVEDASVNIRFHIFDQDENFLAGNTFAAVASGEWVRHDLNFTTGGDDTEMYWGVYQWDTDVTTNFYIDGIQLELGSSPSTWENYGGGGADLTVTHAVWDLAGAIAAQTTVTGDATVTQAQWVLAGAVGAQSALIGDLTVLAGGTTHQLAGVIAAQSALIGDATVTQAQWTLAGSIGAQSVVTGDLAVTGVHQLAGTIAAQSAVIGNATVSHATWQLAGSIGAASVVTGDLTTLESWDLAGTVAAQSALTGNLTVSGTHQLAGTVAATSTTTGALGAPYNYGIALLPSASWPASVKTADQDDYGANWEIGAYIYSMTSVAGAVAGQTTFTGQLTVGGEVSLAGTIAAVAALTGDLTVSHATRVLAGSVAATSAFTGDLSVASVHVLAGTIGAQSELSGDVTVTHATWDLAGAVATTAALTADLTVLEMHGLAGTVTAQSAFTGDLAVGEVHQLAGAIEAVSAFIGNATVTQAQWTLAGTVSVQAALTGNLTAGGLADIYFKFKDADGFVRRYKMTVVQL